MAISSRDVAARFFRELAAEWKLAFGGTGAAALNGLIGLFRHDALAWGISFALAIGCILFASFKVYEREHNLRKSEETPQVHIPPGSVRPVSARSSNGPAIATLALSVLVVVLISLSTRGLWWQYIPGQAAAASVANADAPTEQPGPTMDRLHRGEGVLFPEESFGVSNIHISGGNLHGHYSCMFSNRGHASGIEIDHNKSYGIPNGVCNSGTMTNSRFHHNEMHR